MRRQLGLTGLEAAKAWGVNPRTLQNWEQGRNQPKGFALQAFRQVLNAALSADKPAAPASSVSSASPAAPAATEAKRRPRPSA